MASHAKSEINGNSERTIMVIAEAYRDLNTKLMNTIGGAQKSVFAGHGSMKTFEAQERFWLKRIVQGGYEVD
jgi:hypothetical protein